MTPEGSNQPHGWQGVAEFWHYGASGANVAQVTDEVGWRLNGISGLLSFNTGMDRGSSELQVQFDCDHFQRFGIKLQWVSSSIACVLRGTDINKFHIEDSREVDICMQVTNHDDQSLDALRYITFPSEYGRDVSLEAALSDRHDF